MNATPTRPNKSQRQGAQEDPKQKQDRAQGRARAGQPLKFAQLTSGNFNHIKIVQVSAYQ
jgi:hypothetical protein